MSGRRSGQSAKVLTSNRVYGVVDAEITVGTNPPPLGDRETFDDALHQFVNASPRPRTEADISQLCALIKRLIELCGDGSEDSDLSRERWINFVLSIIHRRYHLRAPEARAEKLKASDASSVAVGDGERLLFYVTVSCMLKYASHGLPGPQKELARVRGEGDPNSGRTLDRADTINQLWRLSEDQRKTLEEFVKARSKSDLSKLQKIMVLLDSVPGAAVDDTTQNDEATAVKKVHTSALCWIPPAGDTFENIQRIRRKHDRQIKRWPPHVNLLYPFIPTGEFEEAAKKLAQALRSVQTFGVNLEEIREFSHSSGSHTAWLHPAETNEFVSLQAACHAAFPHCDDLDKQGAFVPHLSVGQCKNMSSVDALKATAAWVPSRTDCGEVCLISRKGPDDPFEVHWRVELGTGKYSAMAAAGEAKDLMTKQPTDAMKENGPLANIESELKDFVDSGVLAGYLNEVFFGERRPYLSLMSPHATGKTNEGKALINRALECLFHVALHAGGSRDLCALIEFGLYGVIFDVCSKRKEEATPSSTLSTSELTGYALGLAATAIKDESTPSHLIEELIRIAGQTLDSDLDMITRENGAEEGAEEKIISTLNVFLPHHDRGRTSGKKRRHSQDSGEEQKISDRNLVQCVSELLIWSKTTAASSNEAFRSSFDDLIRSASKTPEQVWAMRPEEREKYKSAVKTSVHRLQAIVRRQRKTLNSFARNQGFMLSEQFTLEPQAISLRMIRRGKAGDLARLTALASKSGEAKVLEMINIRNSDPSQAVPIDSLVSLRRGWVPLNGDHEDEVRAVKLSLQEAMVWSTLKHLRKSGAVTQTHPCVIGSLDKSKMNHAASVLVGAAMHSWVDESKDSGVESADSEQKSSRAEGSGEGGIAADICGQRVYIKDRLVDVSSFEVCMERLDEIFSSSGEELGLEDYSADGAATTKDVLNFIDRHVADGDTLILFTSADLQLPDHSLADLQKRGCSLHCHAADNLSARLKREGARTGDVTISLMWDTGDDLDLHVVMPSGEEIMYSNKTSKCGLGCLDVDMNAGGAQSTEPVENVFLGKPDELIQAPKGKYRVFVQNYAYHSSKRNQPVQWRVSVRMNGRVLEYAGACVGTGSGSDQTVCEFDYAGRTVPFEKELENKSAFGTANLVNITASTGQTLESLCQLMRTAEEHRELDRVRELVDVGGEEENAETEEASDDMEVEEAAEGGEADEADEREGEAGEAAGPSADEAGGERIPAKPLVAAHGRLEVTSRDRLHALLCKLPKRFHDEVKRNFGGETLMEKCAADVARRMLQDNVRLLDLKNSGYPPEVVEMVSSIMRKGAVCPS